MTIYTTIISPKYIFTSIIEENQPLALIIFITFDMIVDKNITAK